MNPLLLADKCIKVAISCRNVDHVRVAKRFLDRALYIINRDDEAVTHPVNVMATHLILDVWNRISKLS